MSAEEITSEVVASRLFCSSLRTLLSLNYFSLSSFRLFAKMSSDLSAEYKVPEKFSRMSWITANIWQGRRTECRMQNSSIEETVREMHETIRICRLPIRSSRSTATVSKARRIIGCSSSTSLKLSTLREYRRQYVSARTLAVLRPRVNKQISTCEEEKSGTSTGNEKGCEMH